MADSSSSLKQLLPPVLQVILEALRDGFLGSIAVDDITVTSGACPAQHHCSFEADECGFSVPKQQAWQRQSGAGGWGPPVDHTVGKPRGSRQQCAPFCHWGGLGLGVPGRPQRRRCAASGPSTPAQETSWMWGQITAWLRKAGSTMLCSQRVPPLESLFRPFPVSPPPPRALHDPLHWCGQAPFGAGDRPALSRLPSSAPPPLRLLLVLPERQ